MTASKKQVMRALEKGKITRKEAHAYLKNVHNTSLPRAETGHHWHAYAIIGVMIVGIFLALSTAQQSPTGLVVFEPEENVHNVTNATVNITDPINSLKVSGYLYGDGTASILFRTNDTNYTVASITSETGEPRTAQPSYEPGQNVTIDNVGEDATYYLDDGETSVPVFVPFPAPDFGEYEVLVIENTTDGLNTHRVPLIVSPVPVLRTTEFASVCEQTCVLEEETGELVITTEGTFVDITTIDVDFAGVNEPPVVLEMPDLMVTERTTIDLDEYFYDPAGERLFFSTSQTELVEVDVAGSLLTLTPLQDGEETFIVYASDLVELVQTTFELTVFVGEIELNDTGNDTQTNDTIPLNETDINTTSPTNGTNETFLGCNHPNPNLRPLECLQQDAGEYFPTESIYWEDDLRGKVGKFNQLGNLFITGDIIERTNSTPSDNDFKIGTVDRDRGFQAVVWVDTFGNLHLKGELHEEQTVMAPPVGSYSVLTKRSIYLAYADLNSGDLYIRGNLIPFRKVIE